MTDLERLIELAAVEGLDAGTTRVPGLAPNEDPAVALAVVHRWRCG